MKFLRQLGSLVRKDKIDAEMAEEMRHHVELQTERNLKAGMNPDEARYAALRRFGNVASIQEHAREVRDWVWLEQFGQDFRHAVRQVVRAKGFTAVVVFTLALGIGANTAVFTVINTLLLRTLPVPQPERLVIVARATEQSPSETSTAFSYANFAQFRDRAKSFDGLAALARSPRTFVVTGDKGSAFDNGPVHEVSGDYFSVLGISPVLGRTLSPEDDRDDAAQPVAVVSYEFWQRHFGGESTALGRVVSVDGVAFTIVGVAPRGFTGVEAGLYADMWVPLQMIPRLDSDSWGQRLQSNQRRLRIIARLAPGAVSNVAAAELTVIYQQQAGLAAADPTFSSQSPTQHVAEKIALQLGASGFQNPWVLQFKPTLMILMAVVGLVLLVVCTNVASLLLARGAARQREFALRSALGAGRGRLIRQLLTESLLIAVLGGALGVLFAHWGKLWLASYMEVSVSLRPDAHVLLFTTAVAVASGVLTGLIPALRFSRLDLTDALKDNASGVAGSSRRRLNRVLVVAQIASSVCLLAGAGLFVRTLDNLRHIDVGFARENLLMFRLRFDKSYDATRRTTLFRDTLSAIEALPGVRGATWAWGGLAAGGGGFAEKFGVDGYVTAPGENMTARPFYVGPNFFATVGIPLTRGRPFTTAEIFPIDARIDPAVAMPVVINETVARKFFGEADPIGARLSFGSGPRAQRLEVIGVARNTSYANPRDNAAFELYLPYFKIMVPRFIQMPFQVRCTGAPEILATSLLPAIQRVDPTAWIADVRSGNEFIDAFFLTQERALAQTVGGFSVIALLLAGLGLYGVLAFNVAQRTREIGVRMALGAETSDVITLVIRDGLRLTLAGCLVGLIAALGLARLIESRLYGVATADPITLVTTVCSLIVVALFACWLPARRATKVDPIIALRSE